MSWTEERIDRLKAMWAEGSTASQIAEDLGGVSRNAVIGKAHRLGLESRPSPVKAGEEKEKKVRAAKPAAVIGAEVTLHFRPKDKRRRDADGLAPTLKVVLDALVTEGVLPDDSWVHVPAATCRIHPPNGEPAAMWLTLEEVA